ncbi:fimbrillin family protein [Hallella seregens ATCC 51272]|uniref:Fimbrillin family protein n=1 Tax=Hallella seregens ATCC 51272 TaxID=1336250 RepID=A0ABV5ZJ94_9BACT
MIRFKEYLERRARRAAFMSVCLAWLAVFGGLSLASCANEDLGKDNDKNGGDKGAAVSFNVSEAQNDAQEAAAKAMPGVPVTRAAFSEQLGMMNLTPEDLTTQRLAVQGAAGTDLCLIETTIAGVNPMRQDNRTATAAEHAEASGNGSTTGTEPTTRANITTMTTLGHFSSIGYRGTSATGISNTPWFHDKDTNPDGTLVNTIYWWAAQPFGKFFAIAPREASSYAKLKISPDTYAGTPYVDFEVEPDVKNQKDLMTACSGLVHYDTPNVAPRTDLRFRHALTAVRFKVGQNLSYSKTITKVEIIGAKNKGRYVLPTNGTSTGTWSSLDASTATFTLGGDGTVNVSTTAAVNQIILGNNGDNYTFYMIPQPLSGVSVKIHFSDGSTPITTNLSGTWKPGTTKTYALSQNNSDWQYQLTVTSPAAIAYDQTAAGNYTVQSYREDPVSHVQQPVKWKVVSYQESADGGLTWGAETQTKPTWLTNLSTESGDGGTAAESGTATLTTDIIDKLAPRNNALKTATALGSAGSPYDLSTKGGSVARSTANSYVISAPGHYRIPLVYGNAITNGSNNPSSYQTSVSGTYVLQHFKDHADQDITDPWITQSNSGNNAPDAAKVVWADESGLVINPTVSGTGTNAFVNFEVPASAIKNGNAVIAVTKGGTVVWSWHLWFAPQDVLNTTAVTNFQNKVYNFTNETLGWKYTVWNGTTYSAPRSVRVKVEQTVANGGVKQSAYITITQNNGALREGYSTLYQFGRKDALPGTDAIAQGNYSFDNTAGGRSIGYAIQHPENMLRYAGTGTYSYDWCNATYYNLWSMGNTVTGYNDNAVVKTIYDPCPAGFKMPASNAFTGFTTTGNNTNTQSQFNINGGWDYGWNFNNKISSPDATVYFPASGYRNFNDGSLNNLGNYGSYWSVVPYYTDYGCYLYLYQWYVRPQNESGRSYGFAARPVSE